MTEYGEKFTNELTRSGVALGRLMGILSDQPQILLSDFPREPLLDAISTIPLSTTDIGAEVVLAFRDGDPKSPIIIGKLVRAEPSTTSREKNEALSMAPKKSNTEMMQQDELTLRCGKASITLTKEGKIILRGTYISSRSSGANRIKGGSVHLN